jgi:predicted O-methyltransferase YrrM
MPLNTGWKNWDQHLGKFADYKSPIKIVEVGVFEGTASKWFLTNLCKNKESILFCIDTWEGSPEYIGTDFKKVEEKFKRQIRESGRADQVIQMKMYSHNGLMKLYKTIGPESVDLIFIDASHEARDVISDCVLGWKLLKPNGVMIMDDYEWEDLEQEYFRPRLAIDTFIKNYIPEIKILQVSRQVIVEKLNKDLWESPRVNYKNRKVLFKRIDELDSFISKLSYNDYPKNITVKNKNLSEKIDSNKIELEIHNELLKNRAQTILLRQFVNLGYNAKNTVINDLFHKNKKIIKDSYIIKKITTGFVHANQIYVYSNFDNNIKRLLLHYIPFDEDIPKNIKETKLALQITCLPKLEELDLIEISKIEKNTKGVICENIDNIIKKKFNKLKANYYDSVTLGWLSDGYLDYKSYKELEFKNLDYYIVLYNIINLLISIYCLRKNGSLHLSYRGMQTQVHCEFLSLVSNFFSEPPIFLKNITEIVSSNGMTIIFKGFKQNINDIIYDLIISIYSNMQKKINDSTKASSIGIKCNPVIFKLVFSYEQNYLNNLKKVYIVIKKYKELLDNVKDENIKEQIYNYLYMKKINRYIDTFLTEKNKISYKY